MYCPKCGTQINEEAVFCHNCGEKVVYEYDEQQVSDNMEDPVVSVETDVEAKRESVESEQIEQKESQLEQDSSVEKEETEFDKWWAECSKVKKIFVVAAAGIILCLLIAILKKFGGIIFGILLVIGFILTLKTGSEKEKIEAKKTIVQMTVGGAVIMAIVLIILFKPDFISNIVQPGAGVRNAYLSQYSEDVTVEDAFDAYFENGKWDTYKEGGYSYVTFVGVCKYLGERTDAKITFKLTGENFIVDSLDLNGREQNDLILALLLEEVYKDY